MKEGKLVNGRFYTDFELRKDVVKSNKHQTARSRRKIAEGLFRTKQVVKKSLVTKELIK